MSGMYHQDERDSALNVGFYAIAAIIAIVVIALMFIRQGNVLKHAGEIQPFTSNGYIEELPYEFNSELVHDEAGNSYVLIMRDDGTWQVIPTVAS